MAKSRRVDPHARRLLDLAEQFRRARPWHDLDDAQPFLVELEEHEHPVTVQVLGAAGVEIGLSVFCGVDSYRCALLATAGDPDVFSSNDLWTVTWIKRRDLDDRFVRLLEHGGLRGDGNQLVPCIFACDAHHNPRPLRAAEVRRVGDVLRAVLECYKSGRLRPPSSPRNQRRMLRLRVGRGGKLENVSHEMVPEASVTSAQLFGPILLDPKLADLPILDESLAIAYSLAPPIANESRTTVILAAADATSGRVVGLEAFSGDPVEALPKLIEHTLVGHRELPGLRGRPRRVVFCSQRLFDAASPPLTDLGISAEFEPEAPIFDVLDGLFANLLTFDEAPVNLVAPRELEEWKAVERWSMEQYRSRALGEFDTLELWRLYSGGREDEVIPGNAETAHDSFLEWVACDYRPHPDAPTVIERLLEEPGRTDAERVIFESRRDSILSLFRVASVEAAESLVAANVFDGKEYEVTDRRLSTSLRPGDFVFLRLCPIREWYFPCIAGPALPRSRVHSILEDLESEPRTHPSTGDLRDRCVAVGRLWFEPQLVEFERPRLVNHDGDPIEFVSGLFAVRDWDTLRRALDAHDDFHSAPDDDEDSGLGSWVDSDETVIATLGEVAGTLVVETNSMPRHERARDWLEEIPGVRFVRHSTRTLDDFPNQPPTDAPVELPPEAIRAIVPQLEKKILGWLDDEIPALGGETPRQAVRTSEGRTKVERLINSMIDPTSGLPDGVLDFEELRRRMRSELGLD